MLNFAAIVITLLGKLLHFALGKLLHFAAIVITLCGVTHPRKLLNQVHFEYSFSFPSQAIKPAVGDFEDQNPSSLMKYSSRTPSGILALLYLLTHLVISDSGFSPVNDDPLPGE